MTENVTQIRDSIIQAALLDVAFDGWNWDLAGNAAKKTGYKRSMAAEVFPGRLKDLTAHFADFADRRMLEAIQDLDPESMRVRDRVKTALMARFTFLQPHKEAGRLYLSYCVSHPWNMVGTKALWRTADRIWDWAGDTATDYNRYTKRGLLSGVITSTTLAWLNDDSEDQSITEGFLDRRIENVMQLGKAIGSLKKQRG